jgi:hypothetical protein
MVSFFRRQAGDKVGDKAVDDVRRVRRDDCWVLVFRVPKIAGHAVGVEKIGQCA